MIPNYSGARAPRRVHCCQGNIQNSGTPLELGGGLLRRRRHAKTPREAATTRATLTKDLENFIARAVQAGNYANSGEAVCDALGNLLAKDDPAGIDSRESAEILLPAVPGRDRRSPPKHFDRRRLRARRKPARARAWSPQNWI